MELSTAERQRLLECSTPHSDAVRKRVNDYLGRTGLNYADLARRINYAAVSLRFFLAGTYGAKTPWVKFV